MCPCLCWATRRVVGSGWYSADGAAWQGDTSRCGRPRAARRATSAYAIIAKRYSEQRLKVAPATVDLSPEDHARYERERVHLAAVMATFTEAPPEAMHMRVPVAGPPLRFLRLASRVQRPVTQSAQRHGHRGRHRHTGVGTAGGPGHRHGRLFLQRRHGVARPRRRPADDGLPPEFDRREGGRCAAKLASASVPSAPPAA